MNSILFSLTHSKIKLAGHVYVKYLQKQGKKRFKDATRSKPGNQLQRNIKILGKYTRIANGFVRLSFNFLTLSIYFQLTVVRKQVNSRLNFKF